MGQCFRVKSAHRGLAPLRLGDILKRKKHSNDEQQRSRTHLTFHP